MTLRIGKLEVSGGSMRRRVWRLWVPCSAHVWRGDRGLHLFAFPFGAERDGGLYIDVECDEWRGDDVSESEREVVRDRERDHDELTARIAGLEAELAQARFNCDSLRLERDGLEQVRLKGNEYLLAERDAARTAARRPREALIGLLTVIDREQLAGRLPAWLERDHSYQAALDALREGAA